MIILHIFVCIVGFMSFSLYLFKQGLPLGTIDRKMSMNLILRPINQSDQYISWY